MRTLIRLTLLTTCFNLLGPIAWNAGFRVPSGRAAQSTLAPLNTLSAQPTEEPGQDPAPASAPSPAGLETHEVVEPLLKVNGETGHVWVAGRTMATATWDLSTFVAGLPPDQQPDKIYLVAEPGGPLGTPCSDDVAALVGNASTATSVGGYYKIHRGQLPSGSFRFNPHRPVATTPFHVKGCLFRQGRYTGQETNVVRVSLAKKVDLSVTNIKKMGADLIFYVRNNGEATHAWWDIKVSVGTPRRGMRAQTYVVFKAEETSRTWIESSHEIADRIPNLPLRLDNEREIKVCINQPKEQIHPGVAYESRYGNNCLTKSVSSLEQPSPCRKDGKATADLQIMPGALFHRGRGYGGGDPSHVKFTIFNAGSRQAKNFHVKLSGKAEGQGAANKINVRLPAQLGPGRTKEIKHDLNLEDLSCERCYARVWIELDPDDRVEECNDDNNRFFLHSP